LEEKEMYDEQPNKRKVASNIDIILMGIARIIVGFVTFWNTSVDMGYYQVIAATLYFGTAYVCISLCLAEMASALPFTGGLYGFVRGITKPSWGLYVVYVKS
jgi:amino acid transporter